MTTSTTPVTATPVTVARSVAGSSPGTAPPLAPGRWELDRAHSAVGFSVRHLGISKVRGRFAILDAVLLVGESAATTRVAATVDVGSVDTGNADRDAHLRTEEFFDTEQWPTMHFTSTGVEGDGAAWRLTGDLTIRDITRPVTFDVDLHGVAPFIDGTRHAGFTATTRVRRSDHGITTGGPLLGEQVEIELDLQFVEPQPPPTDEPTGAGRGDS